MELTARQWYDLFRNVSGFGLIAFLGAVCFPVTAHAEDSALATARKAFEDVEFAVAAQSLERALEQGGHSQVQLAEIYRLSGQVAVAMGRTQAANDAFTRWVLVEPKATFGPEVSPKITAVLEQARSSLSGKRFRLTVRSVPGSDTAPAGSISVEISENPLAMIATVQAEFSVNGAPRTVSAAVSSAVTLSLPTKPDGSVTIRARDSFGNDLHSTIVPAPVPEPAVAQPIIQVDTARSAKRPMYARWYVWAGASAALLATGIGFGLSARSAQDELDDITAGSEQHVFRDAQRVEDRGQRSALIANVSIAASAGFAVLAGVLAWKQLSARRGEEIPRTSVVPTVTATSASAQFVTHF